MGQYWGFIDKSKLWDLASCIGLFKNLGRHTYYIQNNQLHILPYRDQLATMSWDKIVKLAKKEGEDLSRWNPLWKWLKDDKDDHLLPFDGRLNWDIITNAIAKTPYKTPLNFETPKDRYDATDTTFYRHAFFAAEKLERMIATHRT